MKYYWDLISGWDFRIFLLLIPVWVFIPPWASPLLLMLPLILFSYLKMEVPISLVTKLNIPILVITSLTLLSLGITEDIYISLPKAVGMIFGVTLYFIVVKTSAIDGKANIWILYGFLLSGLIISVLGLFGADWFDKYPGLTNIAKSIPHLFSPISREAGYQPNALSGILTLLTPLPLYWLIRRKEWLKDSKYISMPVAPNLIIKILWFIVSVELFWWLLSQTRGALIGMVIGLAFIFIGYKLPNKLILALVSSLSVGLLVYYLLFNLNLFADLVEFEIQQGTEFSQFFNTRNRIWQGSLSVIKKFPLTGVGFDILPLIHDQYFNKPILFNFYHAHNMWLNIGVTLGLGGIISYFVIWILNFHTLIIVQKIGTEFEKVIAIGLMGGWIAFFVFGIVDTIVLGSKQGIMIWYSLALGESILNRTSRS